MPIATALIVAAAAYAAGQGAQKKDGEADDNDEGGGGGGGGGSGPENITAKFLENKTSVELLPLEQSLTMLEWPIATVSFYRCDTSDNTDAALEKLERRVRSVLRANPWLGGWLVRGRGIGSFDLDNTPRLWYDPAGDETAPGAFVRASHDDVPLDENTPYPEYETVLCGGTLATTVRTNPEIVNRMEEPLFRVVAIPSPPGGFALVVSMSHICGDAHTYYRIYNMVVGNAPVASLTPKRPWTYNQKLERKMGREEARYVRDITTDPVWMKLFRMGSDDGSAEDEGSELRGRAFLVNRRWIGDVKASHMVEGEIESNKADVYASTLRSPMTPVAIMRELEKDADAGSNPTQSTNDILVSFFWRLVNPDVGLMAVNFRGRLEGVGGGKSPTVTEDHAGNYANPIPYTRTDYESPALIRKSLGACRRAGAVEVGRDGFVSSTSLPRPSPDLTFSVITNWSSFLRSAAKERGEDEDDANLSKGLCFIRHLPIIHPRRMMRKMPKRMSYLVIFSSGVEDIGCVLVAPGRVMEEIDACGVMDELIAEF